MVFSWLEIVHRFFDVLAVESERQHRMVKHLGGSICREIVVVRGFDGDRMVWVDLVRLVL
jgi:hypothetical protein